MSTPSHLESRFSSALAASPGIPEPMREFCFALAPDPQNGWAGGRRWRYDFAWPEYKIAVEIDGIYSAKSRHRTASGFSADCDKLNVAAQLGWRVLRYTSRHLASDEGCAAAVEQTRKILSPSVSADAGAQPDCSESQR